MTIPELQERYFAAQKFADEALKEVSDAMVAVNPWQKGDLIEVMKWGKSRTCIVTSISFKLNNYSRNMTVEGTAYPPKKDGTASTIGRIRLYASDKITVAKKAAA